MSVMFEPPAPIEAVSPVRLDIGLVNNMPDSAVAATERQFTGLLRDAAGDLEVRTRFYALDSVPRSEATRAAMNGVYRSAADLVVDAPDGLIITGSGPVTPILSDEPYWRDLVEVFDFARDRTFSTIFSCLAAHAAVLHWDGIARRRLPRKLSGVYASRVVAPHPLVEGFPASLPAPHSRYNDLDEAELAGAGYVTLLRSDKAGVDVFVREDHALLVCLQGHPEYDADSIAKEYRRDVKRFTAGELANPSNPPEYEFAVDWMPDNGEAPWRANSTRLYRNWLRLIAERKQGATAAREARG